jgi:hypothetical protein
MMKVSECDFCETESEELISINDDVWLICDTCMELHYRILPRHHVLTELQKKTYCPHHKIPFADCGCEAEWYLPGREYIDLPDGEEE